MHKKKNISHFFPDSFTFGIYYNNARYRKAKQRNYVIKFKRAQEVFLINFDIPLILILDLELS